MFRLFGIHLYCSMTNFLTSSSDLPARTCAWIEDRQNPTQQSWSNNFNAPFAAMNTDFGLITRVFDSTTERPVVVVSGIAAYGTIAAGEFLTNEKYMQMVAAKAPKGWERRNVQVVFSTSVINGNSGPPEILATHFW